MINRASQIFFFCLSIFAISNAVAEVKHEYPKTREERRSEELGSILGAEGLTFSPSKIKNTSTQSATSLANTYLWNATLEALSFAPLASTDSAGGVIITEWYTPKSSPQTSLKIVANIKGNTIDPTNLELKVYKRKKVKGEWINQYDASQQFISSLEEKILRKARKNFLATKEGAK